MIREKISASFAAARVSAAKRWGGKNAIVVKDLFPRCYVLENQCFIV